MTAASAAPRGGAAPYGSARRMAARGGCALPGARGGIRAREWYPARMPPQPKPSAPAAARVPRRAISPSKGSSRRSPSPTRRPAGASCASRSRAAAARSTAVGHLPGVRPGECLRLTGRWERDRRFGEQFKVATYLPVTPATLVGIERYLASGLIRGHRQGDGRAPGREVRPRRRWTSSSKAPKRLEEVEGIGPARRALIAAAWAEQRAVREVMLFLQSHGVPTAHAHRIWRQYGDAAIAVVRENPYQLAEEVFGIGFRTADTIARSLGLPADAPRRLEAGLVHALTEAADGGGNVYLPRAELLSRAAELLQVAPEPLEHAVDELDRRGLVRAEPLPGNEDGGAPAQPVYLARLFAAETAAAGLLAAILAAGEAGARVDVEAELERFESEWGMALAAPQREAVRRALAGHALVITGGPGTGKTTIINAIVRILERARRADPAVRPDRARRQAHGGGHGAPGADDPPPARVQPAQGGVRAPRRPPPRGRPDRRRRDVDGRPAALLPAAQGRAAGVPPDPRRRRRPAPLGRAGQRAARPDPLGRARDGVADRDLPPGEREPDRRQRAPRQQRAAAAGRRAREERPVPRTGRGPAGEPTALLAGAGDFHFIVREEPGGDPGGGQAPGRPRDPAAARARPVRGRRRCSRRCTRGCSAR